eukprot:gene9402-10390_t
MASTQDKLKASFQRRNAKAALDEVFRSVGYVTGAKSLGQLPRGPSQIYSMRHAAKTDARAGNIQISEKNKEAGVGYNSLWTLLERAKGEEESCDEIFIRECNIHPNFSVVIASDRQMQQLVQFCTDPLEHCILGVDPTFNIFESNISLTVTSYRNLRLISKETNKHPVLIGPIFMHQSKDWRTYSRFARSLITEKPELEGLLACGTDGELALIDGLSRNFKFAVFLRCFIHFKDNIKRELTSRGMRSDLKQKMMDEIFGKSSGDVMYTGLVDSDTESEFDIKLESLRPSWEDRERESGKGAQKHSFFDWFKKEKVADIKKSMLKQVRIEAGLGDPPTTYTTNDVEAANFMVKHGLSFDQRTPHDFIADVKKVISI